MPAAIAAISCSSAASRFSCCSKRACAAARASAADARSALSCVVARLQRLAHGLAAAERQQDRDQRAEVEQLRRQLLDVERRRLVPLAVPSPSASSAAFCTSPGGVARRLLLLRPRARPPAAPARRAWTASTATAAGAAASRAHLAAQDLARRRHRDLRRVGFQLLALGLRRPRSGARAPRPACAARRRSPRPAASARARAPRRAPPRARPRPPGAPRPAPRRRAPAAAAASASSCAASSR